MSTTPDQIDLWRSVSSEHQRLEFKEAKAQFDNRKLFKYCVAIANEGGGQLLLGVADKPPRPVVGTAAFNNPVEMAEKIFQAVGFRVAIEEVMHPDGRVLVFHIPSRPRGTAYHLDGTYLMRSGEDLVPMSEDQLRRIFAEGEPDWLEEPSMQGLDAQ
jgi:ATP-dependent DNA helicase RecG